MTKSWVRFSRSGILGSEAGRMLLLTTAWSFSRAGLFFAAAALWWTDWRFPANRLLVTCAVRRGGRGSRSGVLRRPSLGCAVQAVVQGSRVASGTAGLVRFGYEDRAVVAV